MSRRLRAFLRVALFLVTLFAVVAIAGTGIRTVLGRGLKATPSATVPPDPGEPRPPTSLIRALLGIYLSLHEGELSQPAAPGDARQLNFSVAPGETAATIGPRLEQMELIRSSRLFTVLVRYRGVDNALEAGDYRLSPGMTLEQIVTELQHGRVRSITVTVPEGWRMEQVAVRLAEAGLGKPEEFLALMRRHDYPYSWLQERPEGAPDGLEGFLFPDTYHVPVDATPVAVIDLMLRNFGSRVTPELAKALTKQGLSFYEAIGLASIVEREAVMAEERPIIAAVFLGRLDKGMYLQADPTVSYAKGFDATAARWWQPMFEEDPQAVESLYNTFLHGGLPPGPICSPGLASIEAVANPAQSSYLYFVSKGDGSHAFAETFEEHLANAQKYQNR